MCMSVIVCHDIKERCFILTLRIYGDLFSYANKIDEMHKYSLKCNITIDLCAFL